MLNINQVRSEINKLRITAPLTDDQLKKVFNFLAPGPKGREMFNNFVLINEKKLGYKWIDEKGCVQEENDVHDLHLFDFYKLKHLIIAEVCGNNRNWILFDEKTPKTKKKLNPNSIVINESIDNKITIQLISVIRKLDNNIPLIFDAFEFLNHSPLIELEPEDPSQENLF